MTEKGIKQTNRETCYFCGSEGPIQSHHIIPRRHGGGDDTSNFVDLCPTCHERIERLYDDRFFAALGVGKPDKRVSIIHKQVADQISETREKVHANLSRLETEIMDKYVRGDITEIESGEFNYKQTYDPDTETGTENARFKRELQKRIHEIIDRAGKCEVDFINETLDHDEVDELQIEHEIEKLKSKGEVYEPRSEVYQAT